MITRRKRMLALLLCAGLFMGNGSITYASEVSEELVEEEQVSENNDRAESTEENQDNIETEREVQSMESSAQFVEMDGKRETEELYGVNEDGSMYLIEENDNAAFPVITSSGTKLKGTSDKVVNFRANAAGAAVSSSSTTEYTEYMTGASGYTCGAYGADAAYIGTENGKVKFMLAGVVGLVDASKVQVVSFSSAQSTSVYYADSEYLMHRITMNMTTPGWGTSIRVGKTPSYLTKGSTYYSYDGHYFYTSYASMISDYQSDTRKNSVNSKQPYYNYYQFLPERSTSSYSGSELSNLINQNASSSSKMYNLGNSIVSNQNKYGTNALLVTGVAANESAWGNSNYAKNRNNLFGIAAFDANPDNAYTFSSAADCVAAYSETYLSKRYLRPGYTYYHGGYLGDKAGGMNVSWASDPYWGEKAANVAWLLDRAGGGKDQGKYTIGIKDTVSTSHNSVNVRKENSTASGSTVLYNTGSTSGYAVIVKESAGDFYKIQSDAVLTSGRTGINRDSGIYNISNMYAYISKAYVQVVSSGSGGVTVEDKTEGVDYSVHAQTYGWMNTVKDGSTSGTTNEAKRLEAIRINLRNPSASGNIEYRAYCQTYGWRNWAKNGEESGTSGEAKRMEAVQIRLTGEMANKYDVYYRTHVQSYGWLDWAKNGEMAGTAGYAKRMEAIQIVLVAKNGKAPGSTARPCVQTFVSYRTHVQSYGWQSKVTDGEMSGTSGEAKRLEGIQIQLTSQPAEGSIEYRTHVQSYGWQNWVKDGATSGTIGEAKRLEAIQIRLTGEMAKQYDVYYRVHAQTYGWLDWAKNGEYAGTAGLAKRLEGIEIRIVKKNAEAPGATEQSFVQTMVQYRSYAAGLGWGDMKLGGALSGTIGQSKALEGIQIYLGDDVPYKGSIEYKVHISSDGWRNYVNNGSTAGSIGQSKNIQAIKVELTGIMEEHYDVYYRTYCQSYGWLGWAKNGASAGTEGLGKRMEAIQVILVDKGEEAPGTTENPFYQK